MKLLFIFCSIIILISSASAGTITRTIAYNDIYFNNSNLLYKEANVTLSPTPYTDFDTPGYFVTEYLPNGITFINTSADMYKYESGTLSMLKFHPTSSNLQLSYTIKAPKDPGTYTIYGSFQDKNKNVGEIKAQDISIQNTQTTQSTQNENIRVSAPDNSSQPPAQSKQSTVSEPADVIEITAQQFQLSESESATSLIPLLIGLLIAILMVVFIIRKKIKKMPVTYEFIQ